MLWGNVLQGYGLEWAGACLQGELGLLLLQLRALTLHHNAQQLVLQPFRSDHEVQQSHLHHSNRQHRHRKKRKKLRLSALILMRSQELCIYQAAKSVDRHKLNTVGTPAYMSERE